jgi:hypothetical protein
MKNRCLSVNNKAYKNYGGRGIKICDRWLNSFENFLEDIGRRPSKKYSLDRINNDGNYEPSNCKWSTKIEQIMNRRVSVIVTYKGKTIPLIDIKTPNNIPVSVIRYRMKNGWSIDDAIEKPLRKKTKI